MPETACVGICNSKWRAARDAHKAALAAHDAAMQARKPGDPEPERPGAPEIRSWLGDPWCGKCKATIRRELSELGYLAGQLAMSSDGHRSGTGGERVSGSRGSRSPSPSADELDELESVLRSWESALRGCDPPARTGYLSTALDEHAGWLLLNFEPMITHPDMAADFGQEIRDWHRRLTALAKAGPGRHRKPMPCSRCHHLSLYQESGAQYIECARKAECGRLVSIPEYEAEFEEWQKARENLAKAS